MSHRSKELPGLRNMDLSLLQASPTESKSFAQFTRAEKDAFKLSLRILKDDVELINRRLSERALVGLSDTRLDQVKRDLTFEVSQLANQVRRLQESEDGPFSVVERCNSLQNTLQDTRLQMSSETDGIRQNVENLQHKFKNLEVEVRTAISEARECARRQAQMESRIQTLVDRLNTMSTRFPSDQANELHTNTTLQQLQQAVDLLNKRVRDVEIRRPRKAQRSSRKAKSSLLAENPEIWSSSECLEEGKNQSVYSNSIEDELSSLSGLSADLGEEF